MVSVLLRGNFASLKLGQKIFMRGRQEMWPGAEVVIVNQNDDSSRRQSCHVSRRESSLELCISHKNLSKDPNSSGAFAPRINDR